MSDDGAVSDGGGGRSADDPGDADTFALLYAELRALALAQLRGERRTHTLNATALVNEVFLKLSGSQGYGTGIPVAPGSPDRAAMDRGRFFVLAAVAMRRILVDHARRRKRLKRGGGAMPLDSSALLNVAGKSVGSSLDTLSLDEVLTRLAVAHPDAAKVVEMRFFAGLPEVSIAEVLGVNGRTVRRHWTFAKAWLTRELEHEPLKNTDESSED